MLSVLHNLLVSTSFQFLLFVPMVNIGSTLLCYNEKDLSDTMSVKILKACLVVKFDLLIAIKISARVHTFGYLYL